MRASTNANGSSLRAVERCGRAMIPIVGRPNDLRKFLSRDRVRLEGAYARANEPYGADDDQDPEDEIELVEVRTQPVPMFAELGAGIGERETPRQRTEERV